MNENLNDWITEIASLFDESKDPSPEHYNYFVQEPQLAPDLVELLLLIDEKKLDDTRSYYSACIFALDICVAQLHAASESGIKLATKKMNDLMASLAEALLKNQHSLSFWLPILNAFYEVHVELSEELKDAYLELASIEDDMSSEEDDTHLNSMRDLIHELSDLSVFDITENFFAQSYAMPPEFFTDLVCDLYSIPEGIDIALLTLLHPKQEVREVIVAAHDAIIDNVVLSPQSLSRLQAIKNWYPPSYHEQFNRWIKHQRKKGGIFSGEKNMPTLYIKASEVDGSGAQGIYIHFKKNRTHRLCGLLLKQNVGIKDVWVTPKILAKDIARYYKETFDDSITLRDIDVAYMSLLTEHFLAITIEEGSVPDLHLLEMQEELGLQWVPAKLDIDYLIEKLSVQISPFTPDSMHASFSRSKSWPKNKRFTESWYLESAAIDRLVNSRCAFIEGVKVCRFDEAIQAVLTNEMELHRDEWTFHFLWITLWLKVKTRKNEKTWQDSFFIAYAIHTGMALEKIPIMYEICRESVINSIETMQERRTHLNQQSVRGL